MTCTHRGPNGGDLECDRPDDHDQDADTGHTYHSTSGQPRTPKEEL